MGRVELYRETQSIWTFNLKPWNCNLYKIQVGLCKEKTMNLQDAKFNSEVFDKDL